MTSSADEENVFVKPSEQSQACLSYAMARKRRQSQLFYEWNKMCHKQKTPRTIWALLRGLARTDSAKVRLLFELCKCLGRKVMIWRVFLTVVGCFDVQNAAFTNQIGEDTNQIGEFGWMILTLHRHFIDKCEDGLRSGCWHLRSWLAWYGVFPYFCISSNCTRQLKTSFHCSRLQELSQRIINEIVAERRLKR